MTKEEAITGIEVMIGIGLDHMKGRIEIGEIIGVQAKVGPGQVLEQIQIGIGLDVLNVGNMIILQENV